MLRMRLSLDCGYAAVATQGVSDNLFTVESLARRQGADHAEAEACYRRTGAFANQTFEAKFASPVQKLLNVFCEGDRVPDQPRRLFQ
jgi:hypothetical protein